jgi:hypothetical protein
MKSFHLYILAAGLLASSAAGYGQSLLSGQWHGTENNLPVVDLTIEQNAGQTNGSAVFYLIKRNLDGSNAHVGGQASGPMENVDLSVNKLSFTMHRPDGSVVSFRVELTDADHARLFRLGDDTPGGSGWPLVRVKP